MSFSASPLVPDQHLPGQVDPWAAAAALVVAAVAGAAGQVPSASPLTPGEPIQDPAQATLPASAGAAVTGYLAGGPEGKMLLVVGQDLVDALAGTPFGAVEAAQALKPALEAVAAGLGGVLDGDTTGLEVQDCLEVLAGGTTVVIPLMSGDSVAALVGVSLAVVPQTPSADGTAGTSPGATAAGGAPGATPGAGGNAWGIDLLRDVEMEVTCELGRTRMTVRQLLALAPGDVIELDRLAGAPADLLVNGTLLARGEVVVVDESFGLRITEIVTQDAT